MLDGRCIKCLMRLTSGYSGSLIHLHRMLPYSCLITAIIIQYNREYNKPAIAFITMTRMDIFMPARLNCNHSLLWSCHAGSKTPYYDIVL